MVETQPAAAAASVAAAGAESYPRIVAALIRVTGDWTLAQDCAQEALMLAVQRWRQDGIPANPGGWLLTVARNRAIDVLRRASVERQRLRELAVLALTDLNSARADAAQEGVVRDARRDTEGRLVTLDKQNRSRWDRTAIAEGIAILSRTQPDGPYALQARIAACHATAASAEATDWLKIAKCYDDLVRIQPTPVIGLNRAVAHAYADGPAVGLRLLAQARAGGALKDYPHAVAAEADLTALNGDHGRAAELFQQAAAIAHSAPERRALLDRANENSPGP